MPRRIRVLVFPAGSEIAIEVLDALKWQKDVEVYGATSVADHSQMLYRRLAYGLPYFNQPDFLEKLNRVIADWGIDFIYPARDDVQLFLTQHEAELGARVVSSPLETVETCRSKIATYAALAGESFVPATYERAEDVERFPVFAKPAVGEGSKGAQLVESAERMRELLVQDAGLVFCEYLPGTAWTVDCFTDASGELVACTPRTRDRVKAGIAVRSRVVRDAELVASIRAIGDAINARFSFNGAWFFQLKAREDGTPVLMEVSPRVPGTMGLTRNLGVNYPLLTIYQMLGYRLTFAPLSCEALLDKAFISRFELDVAYDTVYMDYDDTLYIGDEVNAQAMAFCYQCKNEGKRLVLLTHHDDAQLGALSEHMSQRGIATSLFDEIIHLAADEHKSDHIDGSAILVDDSFRERQEVAERCGIPTFDVSNIEALLDWRR